MTAEAVKTDVYRRNLQRAYIETMGTKLNPALLGLRLRGFRPASSSCRPLHCQGEARAIIRAELTDLDALIARALPKASDRETKAHLLDSRYQISKILFPEEKL